MRKTMAIVTATFLVFGLIISCAMQIQTVKAELISSISIKPDGFVDPATAPIQHVGDSYKLTANIYNTPLTVEQNNLVLDGQGFTLQGSGISNGQAAINLTCSNVTVTNFFIASWQVGVLGVFDNNTIMGNNFTNNGYDVAIYANNYKVTGNFIGAERIAGDNNVISQNEILLGDYQTGFWMSNSQGTIIESNDVTLTKETTSFVSTDNGAFQVYHNNFLNIEVNTGGAFLWILTYPNHIEAIYPPLDNGYPSGGNYWSDYNDRYSNASEIDASGNRQYTIY